MVGGWDGSLRNLRFMVSYLDRVRVRVRVEARVGVRVRVRVRVRGYVAK